MEIEALRSFFYDWAVVIGAITVAVIKMPDAMAVLHRFWLWLKRRIFLSDEWNKLKDHHRRIETLEQNEGDT